VEKTHYRKAFNSPYLSSADIVEPTVLTIKCVKLEGDKSNKTKDLFNTAYFVEGEIRPGEVLKPMILNAHNSKIMADLTQSKFIDDWMNIPVTIYVDTNVKFGRDTVEGLRISAERPRMRKKLKQGTPAWNNAIEAYKRDGNLEAVLKHCDVSDDDAVLIRSLAVDTPETDTAPGEQNDLA
jgi:hypothetical protein